MNRSGYDRYVRLFNARDYEGVLDHFAEPFELVFAGHVFRTKDEVRRFYAFFHAYVDEQVTVHRLVSDGKMMALEVDVRLEARDDMTPELLARNGLAGLAPLQRGQVVTIPQFIHYHLDEQGKIIRVLCAVFDSPGEA
ncbi:MAG: nuclear transport factor 2 family protein [Allosphingosinicella sp.]